MKRLVIGCFVAATLYVFLGAFLHLVVFPEAKPLSGDRPGSGDHVRLPGGLTLRYQATASESAGEFFETEWQATSGGGFAEFAYPTQRITLSLEAGSLDVVVDSTRQTLVAPAKLVIPPGGRHAWTALSDAHGVWRIEPAGMADFVFMQTDRAFHGTASPLETQILTVVLVGTHGKHAPVAVRALCFVIAPTARLFGVRSYYSPVAGRGLTLDLDARRK